MAKRNKKIFNFIIIIILISMFFVLLPKTSLARDPDDPKFADEKVEDSTASEEETEKEDEGLMIIIKKTIAKWYYIMRYFSIICMLLVLIYLGIKLAISSIAEEQAKYKRMLYDWIVGFVIIFFIHYFMIGVLRINQACVDFIVDLSTNLTDELLLENEMGLQGAGLYETVRTRAYEFRTGIGTSGMVMYMVLVYYTIRFILIYFKRFFTILILTIMAPIAALSYAFTKVNSGKAPILGKWAQEYSFNVFLQTIHALLYGCFVSIALALSDESIVGFLLAMVMLNFMVKADKIFRKIFKFSGSILDSNDNSDFKENMAGLIAAKAAIGTVAANGLAKSAGSSIKRGIGAVSNVGLYAGVSVYSRILGSRDDKLEEKENNSKEMEKQIEEAKTTEEKERLQKEKNKLDMKIAAMQGRRNKLNKYKRQNVSKTALGQIANNKRIEKKAQAVIKAEEAKLGTTLDENRIAQIKEEVAEKHNNKVIRRNVEYNKITGKKEVTSGIAKRLKSDINTAIWGNSEIKDATKGMIKNTVAGISGAAMIAFAIPQIVASPKLGMPLLAKGINNAKKLYGDTGYKKITTSGYRRKIKKTIKKNKKLEKKDQNRYELNRMNPMALNTIKEQMKMDDATNMIRNINTPRLSLAVLTMPLRLTGVLGAARNIQTYSHKVSEARRDYYEAIEIGFAIQTKKTLNQDFTDAYDRKVSRMEDRKKEQLSNETTEEMMLRHKMEAGTIFEVSGKKIEFKNNSISAVTQTDLIDNIILKVAANNKITNLKMLNTDDQFVQLQIIQELANIGLIANPSQISLEENQKQVSKLMEKISERIEVITKENPDATTEKLTQAAIIEYMEKNGIDDPKLLESDEHKEKLKEEILNKLEEAAIQEKEETLSQLDEGTRQEQETEELFNSQVEEIVRKAMETSTSRDEMLDIIETEIREMLLEQHQAESEDVLDIQEELDGRKKKYSSSSQQPEPITSEQADNSTEVEEKVPEIVEKQTQKIVQSVDTVISLINKKDEQKAQTEIFVEDIISSVQFVEEGNLTITEDEQKKLSSSDIIEAILESDVRREVRKSDEFKSLNGELRTFAQMQLSADTPEISDSFIEENLSGSNDELIAYLLAMKEQDKIALELKVKPDSSEKKRFMQIDTQIAERTFDSVDTDINKILIEIKNQK